MASPRYPSRLLPGLLAGLLAATPVGAGELISIPDIPDLKERVAAFREALRGIAFEPETAPPPPGPPARPGDRLNLESVFRHADQLGRAGLDEQPGLPGRRDLVFEEQWLLAGREEEHEDAARHWLGRKLKGSDRRDHGSGAKVKLRGSWDHGPVLGVGRGPWSVRAGESQWRLQWSRRWSRSSGPWRARAWVGEEDGEFTVAFTVGRNLLDSYGR